MAIPKAISTKALTLDTTPGTAMLLKGFQEQLVLVLRPLLPLLGYRVWLACLNGKCQNCDLGYRKTSLTSLDLQFSVTMPLSRLQESFSAAERRTLGARGPSGESRVFFGWSMKSAWPARSAAGFRSFVALISFIRNRKEFGIFSAQDQVINAPFVLGSIYALLQSKLPETMTIDHHHE